MQKRKRTTNGRDIMKLYVGQGSVEQLVDCNSVYGFE